ncbi:Predicted dehydrogenase [Evansella caseinilytica]|uniref:Predicted dehydrogenase n=1 Tax=Evansella caseinilytica TaxID=1503961 RepID=A0A1H3QD90_9BACI|nr:Gfo/Idh/MocA family oxidoreductase [Evansella caseinilytica]SDZ11502.1 Predicted dehydrogenase [Evansella caseinilytica]
MSKKVRWGILSSAGIAAKAIVPAIKESRNAELTAVASESGKAKRTAEEWGAPKYYDSYRALLSDEAIDAVYIPLPNSLHKKWVIEAANSKKHVLVEKPAGVTAQEVKEMMAACEANKVIFMEAFMYQFHPQHARVKEIIGSGEIGDIRLIRSSFSFPLDLSGNNIRLNSDLGGGSLFDVGCYCVHASRFLLAREPEEVYLNGVVHPVFQIDITAAGVMKFGEVTALIDSSFDQPTVDRYEVTGTKGSIEVPYAFRPDKNPDNGDGVICIKDEGNQIVREERFHHNQYTIQMEHFSECVLTGETPSYTGELAYQNLRAIEALYTSLREKRPVTL